MRAISGLVALALGLAAQSATADQIEPTSYPFLPALTVNNAPDVCGPFEAVVTEAFKRENFLLSIEGLEWPEADVEWLQFSNLGVEIKDKPYGSATEFSGIELNRNQDGQAKVLARAAWETTWRGDEYYLVLFPDKESFIHAKQRADTSGREVGPSTGENWVLRDAQDMTPNLFHHEGRPGWSSSLTRRDAVRVNGDVYIVDRGELSSDDTYFELWRVSADGVPELTCHVATFPDETGFALSTLAPESARQLQETLQRISGEEIGGGTLHAHTRLLLNAGRYAARVSLRPWVVAREPNVANKPRDMALWIWGHGSIWNYHEYRRLLALERAARKDLSVYYRDAFGVEAGTAEKLAANLVEGMVGSFFVFRGDWMDRIAAEPALSEQLKATIYADPRTALLEGKLLPGHAVRPAKYDWQDWPLIDPGCFNEPRLSYALDHPRNLAVLAEKATDLDAGNGFGKTSLMYAAHLDLVDSARVLVRAGADVNAATESRHADEASWSCKIGWNSISIIGRTALMYALENASVAMITLLVEAGANPNAVDSNGRDALDYLKLNTKVSRKDRKAIEDLLQRSGYVRPQAQP